jgi:hypothetical protein
MQQGVHPTVQRIGGDAGSCIIFTEVSVNELRGTFDVCWPVIDINPSNRQNDDLCLTPLVFDWFRVH